MSNNAYGLNLSEQGSREFDFISLGGLIQRFDAGRRPYRKAHSVDIHVSGAEFNPAANLSDCFHLNTAVATAMVNYPPGQAIDTFVRSMGVTPFYKHFENNGVDGPNMATVYSDQGCGIRPPVVFYNRANEAAQMLRKGDFEWDKIFPRCRWFHTGGLYTALGDYEFILDAMQKAKEHGCVVSFDLNYRALLWKNRGGLAKAQEIMNKLVQYVDVLVGNEEELQKALGIEGADVEKESKLDPSAFFGMIGKVTEHFPKVKVVCCTLREVVHTNKHNWSSVAWVNGKNLVAPTRELCVNDRVGGGDGFASGMFYGILTNRKPEESLRLGWAHGALLTTYNGDTTMADIGLVEGIASGGSARVQR